MTLDELNDMIDEFWFRTGQRPVRVHLTHEQRTDLIYDMGPGMRDWVRFDGEKEEVMGLELVVSDTSGVT